MARGTTKGLEQQIYDMIPVIGRYERDILGSLIHRFSQANIEEVLAALCERGTIKKCGDKIRPLYVRKESRKVYYSNIAPLVDGTEAVLLHVHNQPLTVTEARNEQQNAHSGR